MHPRIYQSIRVFTHVSEFLNLSNAARRLNMTKGAVSYHIKQLENSLGFEVFERTAQGLRLTVKGEALYAAARPKFERLDQQITELRAEQRQLTVGMTTYFASRWLASRLMRFTSANPRIRLRIQPTEGLIDLEREQLDLAIQWGSSSRAGESAELLFNCPSFATCGATIHHAASGKKLEEVVARYPLLHDFEGSRAWAHWLEVAGIRHQPLRDQLVIADPNVRVEAVINGQGIALNDALVTPEIEAGRLFPLSAHVLPDYGYSLMFRNRGGSDTAAERFHRWIVEEALADASLSSMPDWQHLPPVLQSTGPAV